MQTYITGRGERFALLSKDEDPEDEYNLDPYQEGRRVAWIRERLVDRIRAYATVRNSLTVEQGTWVDGTKLLEAFGLRKLPANKLSHPPLLACFWDHEDGEMTRRYFGEDILPEFFADFDTKNNLLHS